MKHARKFVVLGGPAVIVIYVSLFFKYTVAFIEVIICTLYVNFRLSYIKIY